MGVEKGAPVSSTGSIPRLTFYRTTETSTVQAAMTPGITSFACNVPFPRAHPCESVSIRG
jgi:hypothetical protein